MLTIINDKARLANELQVVIETLCANVDAQKLAIRLEEIVSNYSITRKTDEEIEQDLTEKIELFIAAKQLEGLSGETLKGYQIELGLFAKYMNKATVQITTGDIRSYLASNKDVMLSTMGKKLSVLKSFFVWLVQEEVLLRNPASKVKAPKTPKRLSKALSIEELELLRESCKTIRQRAFIEVLYATGCRLSEVHQINISDIDFQAMSCRVIGKGDKEREVYFSFKAMYHLKKYLNSRTDDCEALMATERKPIRRLSKRGIQREIGIIAKYAGLEDKVSPHVLRHTFATLTLNNGAELVAVQELLGHSSPDTTLRYARITEERKKEQHKKFLVQ